MKPPPFTYHRPASVAEAVGLLGTLDNAKLLAGGQSLMPMLSMRFLAPDHVIDLNRIAGLAYIREANGMLAIGGMTRQRDIELSPLVRRHVPVLADALRFTGHVQTRNRGTLGGSLCHLDPAAEQPAIALLADAEVDVVGPAGRRTIAMADFALGYMTPQVEANEILVEVRFPCLPAGHGYGFEEFSRRHGDFALALAAVVLVAGRDGTIERASVIVAGTGSVPMRVPAAEQALIGRRADAEARAEAAAACCQVEALEDAHASADYRRHLAGVLAGRVLARAATYQGTVQ